MGGAERDPFCSSSDHGGRFTCNERTNEESGVGRSIWPA